MRKLFLCVIVFVFLASLAFTTAVAQAPKAKRINRAIELLSQGQPIYYTGSHSGTDGSFEQGKRDAIAWLEAGRQVGARECRTEFESSGSRVRRVGSG